jgi:predicted MFS family arabinose efflux permease
VTKEPTAPALPLRRNRDFNLLWSGQVLSVLGAQISAIAFPLLVLALTHSPAKAGIVGFAEMLPMGLLMLPAGALVDRWDRKRVMVVADSARCVALASIVLALAFDALSFAQIVVVALVDGIGASFFTVGERSALRQVVSDDQLEAAMVRNQAREYGALLAGQPLGGVLFGLGRFVPFLFDAVSYFVSVVTLLLVRTPFQGERTPSGRTHLLEEVRDGLRWFWRQPFVRTTSLLSMGNDFVLNSLYLVVIVLARERGASSALIGAMFVFLGVGGVLGTLLASWFVRRLRMRAIVVASQWLVVALAPLLFLPGELTPGVVFGAMFLLHPAWSATVSTYRLRVAPEEMQGRVTSISGMLSFVTRSLGYLGAGLLLQASGSTTTLLALLGVAIVVAVAAATSGTVRSAPA